MTQSKQKLQHVFQSSGNIDKVYNLMLHIVRCRCLMLKDGRTNISDEDRGGRPSTGNNDWLKKSMRKWPFHHNRALAP